jgi:hypothetical protein
VETGEGGISADPPITDACGFPLAASYQVLGFEQQPSRTMSEIHQSIGGLRSIGKGKLRDRLRNVIPRDGLLEIENVRSEASQAASAAGHQKYHRAKDQVRAGNGQSPCKQSICVESPMATATPRMEMDGLS